MDEYVEVIKRRPVELKIEVRYREKPARDLRFHIHASGVGKHLEHLL
jgi:hypothetical protein